MNKDKIIKDLKERNDKLQSQYMQEQARNYHLNYVIENDLMPTLKGYEFEIMTLKSDFEAQHELTKKYAEELEKIKQPTIFIDTQDMEERYGEGLYIDYLKEENRQLTNRINDAIYLIKELACYEQETHTYCDDINYYDVHKIVYELEGESE